MAILTEPKHAGAALVSEANGFRSRDAVTITKGQVLLACCLLGLVSIGGVAAATPTVVGTGNGTSSAITVAAGTKVGTWRATCTTAAANGGTFTVTDPDGLTIGTVAVGAAFSGGGLGFTISDGGTDFIVGDYFAIIVRGASAAAFSGNTGNGAMGNITTSLGAKPGVYKLIIAEPAANGGNFFVYDPDGLLIGQGDVAAAFSAGGLAFTLADGATDFVAGDGFDITVAPGSGEYRQVVPTAIDGSHIAVGVLIEPVDATDAAVSAGMFARDCVLNNLEIEYGTLDTTQKATAIAQLKTLGILLRDGK